MRRVILFLLLLINIITTYAQNPYSNNPWILGDSVMLNFNSTPPFITNSYTTCVGGSASVHDTASGALLYAVVNQGSNIYNNLHLYNQLKIPIKNSNLLKCSSIGNSILLLQVTDNNTALYYLFSIVGADPSNCGLYYSTISNNGGLDTGVVLSKNNRILSNPLLSQGLSAVKHGNGKDWWILIHDNLQSTTIGTNLFYTFLLDSNGVSAPFLQNVGSLNSTSLCTITFNSTGTNFILANAANLIEKFDFDRCTGLISNPLNILPQNINTLEGFMISPAISQDDTKLYVGSWDVNSNYYLYQFDLTASNIAASQCMIHQFTNTYFSNGMMKLSQDGKIYWALSDDATGQYNLSNTNLSVINSPNNSCANVNFQPFGFYLGGHKTGTILPNNPDFQLGPLAGSLCAPLVGLEEKTNEALSFKISPNPVSNILSINWATSNPQLRSIRVLDIHGRLINESLINSNDKSQQIDVSTLANGIYVIEIKSSNRSDFKRFIKQ